MTEPTHSETYVHTPQLYLRVKYVVSYVHPVTLQYKLRSCLKSTSVIKVVAMKSMDGATRPSYRLKLKYSMPFSVSYVQLVA